MNSFATHFKAAKNLIGWGLCGDDPSNVASFLIGSKHQGTQSLDMVLVLTKCLQKQHQLSCSLLMKGTF